MRLKDLHLLPRVRDSWSYLYVEHCRIDQDAKAIAVHDERGKVPVPCAALSFLMLGPGTSITHAAIRTLADSGCLVGWTGEESVRYYATGSGETRSAANLLKQARLVSDPALRLRVVRRLYEMRFPEALPPDMTLQQIRGREGARVRDAYAQASRDTGVGWSGRSYKRDDWESTDSVNRALSSANSCLYGLCHAAIVATGFSAALGFVHTGKALSFVYDVADLYKADLTVPLAFREAAHGRPGLEARVRKACRDVFADGDLLGRIVPDIEKALGIEVDGLPLIGGSDEAQPGRLWSDRGEAIEGGVNYSDDAGDPT